MAEYKVGTIVLWNILKGYGFVACEGETDYYLHISQIANRVTPVGGQQVRFKDGGRGTNQKRNTACEVTLLDAIGRNHGIDHSGSIGTN
jgi:cold shock CspA family protein